jgi:hypothetical protein
MSYLRQSQFYRSSNFGVLPVYDAGNLKRRLEIEILGGAVRPFSWQAA